MAGLFSDEDVSGLIVARKDESGNVLEGTFEGTPPTTASKFAPGCKIQDIANGILYVNDGTLASPTWNDQNATATADIDADAITSAKIADDQVDSEHLAAGGIDNEHLADSAVDTEEIAADAVDGTKVADDAVDSEHLAAGGIDLEHMSSKSVDEDNVVNAAGVGGLFVKRTAIAVYDFAADGGSISTIALADSGNLPDNAVITGINYEVLTTCTSSGDAGTMKLTLPSDGDISTAIAINDGTDPWDAGQKFGSVITPIANKTTAARAISVVIAVEAFTAGKIVFFIDYVVSQ